MINFEHAAYNILSSGDAKRDLHELNTMGDDNMPDYIGVYKPYDKGTITNFLETVDVLADELERAYRLGKKEALEEPSLSNGDLLFIKRVLRESIALNINNGSSIIAKLNLLRKMDADVQAFKVNDVVELVEDLNGTPKGTRFLVTDQEDYPLLSQDGNENYIEPKYLKKVAI